MTNDRLCAGSEPEESGRCQACGFSAAGVNPAGAVAALRALPRQWRDTLALSLEAADPETVVSDRPGAGLWSALEHAGHVRDVLHALDIRVQRVLREDNPVLPGTHITPPAGANEQGTAVVLAALGVSVDQLARTIQITPESEWTRSGQRARRTLTALDLVREAVHEAIHHLHLAETTIVAVRMAPTALTL